MTRAPRALAVVVAAAVAVAALGAGCAAATELGVIQRAPGAGTGGSLTGHWAWGVVPERILVAGVDVRGDLAPGASRLAVGGSVQGGLPVLGGKLLARAGLWHAVAASGPERGVVPSFELAGYLPIREDPIVPGKPYGGSSSGFVIGVREDLDQDALTTIFVGVAVYLLPGY